MLYTKGSIGVRDAYKCKNCKNRLLGCRRCTQGMAKGHTKVDDQLCAVCDGTFESWEAARGQRKPHLDSWCSWCLEKTSHELVGKGYTVDTYKCGGCEGKSCLCKSCKHAMAWSGDTWNSLNCICCRTKDAKKKEKPTLQQLDLEWEALAHKRDEAFSFEKFKSNLLQDLQRKSSYREKAYKEGVLKPFLLLVSMPPSLRFKVANLVEISLISEGFHKIF